MKTIIPSGKGRSVSALRATATAIMLAALVMGASSAAIAQATIKQVRVEGTQRIEPATVMSYIDVQRGIRLMLDVSIVHSKACMQPACLPTYRSIRKVMT